MKRILITGTNSYIGTSVERYLSQWPDEYQVDTLDMVDGSWRERTFAGYDSVFHVAGIAHINTKKLDKAAQQRYWAVNAEMPSEVASKAKAARVKQFIFLSSMSVYGQHGNMRTPVVISSDTKPQPADVYGKSKLEAETKLNKLNADAFCICILRPPMIYGPMCKGNYQLLKRAAANLPFFPEIANQRSMLNISNLCIIIKHVIDNGMCGIFLPQDANYVCTSKMVSVLAADAGKRMRMTKLFNPAIKFFSGKIALVDKVFGSLVYAKGDNSFEHLGNGVDVAAAGSET